MWMRKSRVEKYKIMHLWIYFCFEFCHTRFPCYEDRTQKRVAIRILQKFNFSIRIYPIWFNLQFQLTQAVVPSKWSKTGLLTKHISSIASSRLLSVIMQMTSVPYGANNGIESHFWPRMALINKCNVKMTVDSYSKITILEEQKIRMVLQ